MTVPSRPRIKFLVYSQTNGKTISDHVGRPEYSYYYIVKHYMPIMEQLGEVEIVYEPETEVDSLYKECMARGQPCVFLHFSAPHNVFPNIECPTVRVFAWEFDTIPDEPWYNEGNQDWRASLARSVGAIAISSYTTKSITQAMGPDFPVASVPCPVWDNFESFRRRHADISPKKSASIHFNGVIVDSRMIDLRWELPTNEEIDERIRFGDAKMAIMAEKSERLWHAESELYAKIRREWNHLIAMERLFEEAEEESLLEKSEGPWRDQRGTRSGRLALLRGATARFATDVTCALGLGKSRSAIRRMWRVAFGLNWLKSRYKAAAEEAKRKAEAAREAEAANGPEWAEDESKERELEKKIAGGGSPPRSSDVVDNAVYLEGYVYASILNPYDMRKNWQDLVIGFCWAFRDVEDATLVIKSSASHIVEFADELIFYLKRLAPLKCRVVLIHAFLDDPAYEALMEATTYFVNTSYGEGQSIPLCEAMSAGIPAVAPDHTAMSEYVLPDGAFIFKTNTELTSWQHDPRRAYRCIHYRPDWLSLVDAYRRSYELAKSDSKAYAEMGRKAAEHLKNHCSVEAATRNFREFIEQNYHLFDHSGRSANRLQGLSETA